MMRSNQATTTTNQLGTTRDARNGNKRIIQGRPMVKMVEPGAARTLLAGCGKGTQEAVRYLVSQPTKSGQAHQTVTM